MTDTLANRTDAAICRLLAGGPLPTAALAAGLAMPERTVRHRLYRLRQAGAVVSGPDGMHRLAAPVSATLATGPVPDLAAPAPAAPIAVSAADLAIPVPTAPIAGPMPDLAAIGMTPDLPASDGRSPHPDGHRDAIAILAAAALGLAIAAITMRRMAQASPPPSPAPAPAPGLGIAGDPWGSMRGPT